MGLDRILTRLTDWDYQKKNEPELFDLWNYVSLFNLNILSQLIHLYLDTSNDSRPHTLYLFTTSGCHLYCSFGCMLYVAVADQVHVVFA